MSEGGRLRERKSRPAGPDRGRTRIASILCVILVASAGLLVVSGDASAGASARSVTLRVMTFNIFYGGDELDLTSLNYCTRPEGCQETLAQVVETIRTSGADVVGIQEGVMNAGRIAERLGWYASERMQIISRHPLLDPPGGNGIYVFVELLPGRVAALANVHLPADPYGPYEAQAGATLEDILALEEGLRLPEVQDQIRVLPQLAAQGIPVFLTGDFNSPSHLDWTEAVAAARADVPYPVAWPVSVALAEAGFRDSFRDAHPDPLARPGFTWTPGSPEGIRSEVHDRIDWVLAAGTSSTMRSELVGESAHPDVDIAVDPWPSDHRGLVSTFDVTPAAMPVLVSVSSRRLELGDALDVRFHAPGRSGERIGILPAGGTAASAVAFLPTGGAVDGTLSFDTTGLPPRAYEAALLAKDGRVLARIPFWLYAAGTPTTVTTSRTVYAQGEPIEVSWANAPGMKWDWLGLYEAGANDGSPIATTCFSGYCGNGHYLLYEYTDASIEGTASFTASSAPGYATWPLRPGVYEVRLLLDDGYRSVASSIPFKIVQG